MKLGPRVLGEDEFQRQQQAYEEAKKRAFVYGPRVVGGAPATEEQPATATATREKPPQPSGDAGDGQSGEERSAETLSLSKLNDALQGDLSDEMLDGFLAAEFEREGEPRKGALRLLLRSEESRGDAARPAIVAELQNALKE